MVKNLIFDFGAVLIPIDEEKTWQAFEDLGAEGSLADQHELFKKMETGKIKPQNFLKKLRPHFFRSNIFLPDLADAWSAICYAPIPEENIYFLKRLRNKGYRLFLLSNTNQLHIAKIKEISGPFRYRNFINQFDQVYYSHEVGLSKPTKKIYEKVLQDHDLEAAECFFTDDKQENVKAAEKLGFKSLQFNPHEGDIRSLERHIAKLAN